MGFLAPWFLGGLALLGVPVFVHLLRRHVTIPRPVSSLMFFERGIQSSTRHHRLKHLVLSCSSLRAGPSGSSRLCQPVRAPSRSKHEWPLAAHRSRQLVQHARRHALCRCQAAGACEARRKAAIRKRRRLSRWAASFRY